MEGAKPDKGVFQKLPRNDPVNILLRVYVIRANNLPAMDLNGRADPFVSLFLGNKKIEDKENYVPNQLNPIFGK